MRRRAVGQFNPNPTQAEIMLAELAHFHEAYHASQLNVQKFVEAAQKHEWKQAGDFQLMASAALDCALDAYTASCRAQAACGEGNKDG